MPPKWLEMERSSIQSVRRPSLSALQDADAYRKLLDGSGRGWQGVCRLIISAKPFVGLLLVCIAQASYFLKGKETLVL